MAAWHDDFLDGYETLDLPLTDVVPALGEPAGVEMVGTLVRRDGRRRSRRALLYLHGWNDYFFQTHLADTVAEIGIDFYAIDLRRFGRSLRRGQLRGFITDLDDYDAELGAAADVIAQDHDDLILMGHSTGGLIAALWAAQHQDRVSSLVLNSPWLDLQGSAMVRMLGTPVIDTIGSSLPTRVLRLPELGFYARTVHASLEGEWDYDLDLKQIPSPPIRAGWLRAILIGQQRVATGLGLTIPTLVMCSAHTSFSRRWSEKLREADIVLDVEQIAKRSLKLGRHLTLIRIDQGMHDLLLSAPAVRKQALDEMSRWLEAYGSQPG